MESVLPAFHLGVLCRRMEGEELSCTILDRPCPHTSRVCSTVPSTAVSFELWLCRLHFVNCFASVIKVTPPVAESLGEADTLFLRLFEVVQAPSLVLPSMSNICPLWPCCSPASLTHSLCPSKNTTDAPGWPPAFPGFPLIADTVDNAGSHRQSFTPFSVPTDDESYSLGWID